MGCDVMIELRSGTKIEEAVWGSQEVMSGRWRKSRSSKDGEGDIPIIINKPTSVNSPTSTLSDRVEDLSRCRNCYLSFK